MHVGVSDMAIKTMNLPPGDNLRKEDKSSNYDSNVDLMDKISWSNSYLFTRTLCSKKKNLAAVHFCSTQDKVQIIIKVHFVTLALKINGYNNTFGLRIEIRLICCVVEDIHKRCRLSPYLVGHIQCPYARA